MRKDRHGVGCGLAGVLKIHYPRKLVYVSVFSLVIANSINAGADIGLLLQVLVSSFRYRYGR